MENRWNDAELSRLQQASPGDEDRVACAYLGRCIGFDPTVAQHGGGNVSVKAVRPSLTGAPVEVLLMKSTGRTLAAMDVDDLCPLRLEPLRSLRDARASDEAIAREIQTHRLSPDGASPSIETLLHALLPARFVAHTHPEAVIGLGSLPEGLARLREAVGDLGVALPYAKPGLALAQAGAQAAAVHPTAQGLVLQHHGLVSWGDTARQAHDRLLVLLDLVERALAAVEAHRWTPGDVLRPERAQRRYRRVAGALRRALATVTPGHDHTWRTPVLRVLQEQTVLEALALEGARTLLETPPITADQLLHVGPWPLWIDASPDDPDLASWLERAVQDDDVRYREYAQGHRIDTDRPQVVAWPGVGVVCAATDVTAADRARDIMAQVLRVKRSAAERGGYHGLTMAQAREMEFCPVQRRKLVASSTPAMAGRVALVTGAAGAIGSAVVDALLQAGAHVVVTDLDGPLQAMDSLPRTHGARVTMATLDVTQPASVTEAFDAAVDAFGGIDLVVVNAGLAHVASLADLDLDDFRRLEAVNVEGTLLVLAEASRRFSAQGTGGDVVVISTKNVFAPGAEFGAYSATKAASHQLARVASLELAPLDVRVNLVAPDAVFAHGDRRSGLWDAVGPSRMKSRGLDEAQLRTYYRERNLLKATVTAEHVARAVLFFATRQTPTTGATLPVDGGLPEATPR